MIKGWHYYSGGPGCSENPTQSVNRECVFTPADKIKTYKCTEGEYDIHYRETGIVAH